MKSIYIDILKKYDFLDKNGNLDKNYKKKYKNITDLDDVAFIDSSFPEYTDLSFKLKSMINGDYKRCEVCNTIIEYKFEKRTCSKKCSSKLREDTTIARFGVKCSLQNEIVKEKSKKTCIEKYGVEVATASDIVKDKIKKTNIEKYGTEYPLQNESILKATRETSLKNNGAPYPLQNKEILNKTKNSLFNNYNVYNPSHSQEVLEKMKQTNIEKYGCNAPAQNKKVLEKMKQTNIEKYGFEWGVQSNIVKDAMNNSRIIKNKNYINARLGLDLTESEVEQMNINRYTNYSNEYLYSVIDYYENGVQPPLNILRGQFSYSAFYKKSNIFNYEFKNNISSYEEELCDWLESINIQYNTNVRDVIVPYELDIYIPEHNMAIEFNGYYWHSDKFVDKKYHQMKTKMCNEKGITLIHIHEYLYKDKSEIYNNIIKSKLNLNERVYARKCILKEVPKQEEKEFLNNYHLQGFVGSNKCYGLYYNDELLTLCSFGKSRFNKKYEYELLRNCTKPNITVVGGLSKIIKHYKNEIDNKDIVCYSDASISYNKNSELTSPNYVWIKNNLVLKRYQTMKHKLPALLNDNFDKSLSETENMKNNGFCRVYDSGNYITIY